MLARFILLDLLIEALAEEVARGLFGGRQTGGALGHWSRWKQFKRWAKAKVWVREVATRILRRLGPAALLPLFRN